MCYQGHNTQRTNNFVTFFGIIMNYELELNSLIGQILATILYTVRGMAMWLLQKLRARGREYLWVLLPTTTEHLILVGTKFSILMPGKMSNVLLFHHK